MIDDPKRIQLRRTKGWRMPPDTVKVDRSTVFGNPFRIENYRDAGYKGSPENALAACIEAYREWVEGRCHWAHGGDLPAIPDAEKLRGKNLACWCPLDKPCHADVLLELANQ